MRAQRNLVMWRSTHKILLVAIAASLLSPSLATSEEALAPAAQRGLVFVRTHCAKCHSIDRVSRSPLPMAPAFRTLHERSGGDAGGITRRGDCHRSSLDAGIQTGSRP